MAPYFSQNKVITVNLSRLDQTELETAGIKDANGYVSQKDFKTKFDALLAGKPASYKNIFTELKKLGANKLTINDYMRDNLMIGSETEDANTFENTPTDATFENQVNGMKSVVNLIATSAL